MHTPTPPAARRARWLAVLPLVLVVVLTPMVAVGAGLGRPDAEVAPALEVPLGSSVLTLAVQSLGTFQGECFPWVRSVVKRATGRLMGYSYRAGYLDAGAIEVPLESARGGDVIQLISDRDDGADADYPGMHTSIVFSVQAPGVFRVIDSNLEFDGIVRIRDGYNPMALAARFSNINVHVYRFYDGAASRGTELGDRIAPSPPLVDFGLPNPGLVGPPSGPTYSVGSALSRELAPPGSAPQQAAASAVIRADGDCLRLRAAPAADAPVLTCLPDGGTVSLLQGTQQADGVAWQAVSSGGQAGWVASQYLVRSSGPAAPPAPSSPPVAAPAPAPVVPAAAPAVASAEGSPAIIGDLPGGSGGLALVVFSGGPVNGLLSVVAQRGCNAVSIWASRTGGGLVGMIPGAPSIVNREWRGEFPSDALASRTPLIVVCGGGAAPATVAAAPAPGLAAAGPPSVARGGTTPPGPAGNE